VPTCTAPSGVYPAGSPPQITGYSATNTGEAETVSGGAGNCAFTRTGANAYQMVCAAYAPLASPSFTGTVTMPDASTINTNGYNSVKALGIGQASAGDPLDITRNQSNATLLSLSNNSTGTAAQLAVNLVNATHSAAFRLLGTGYTAAAGYNPDQLTLDSNAANGINIMATASTTPIFFTVMNGSTPLTAGRFDYSISPAITRSAATYTNFTAENFQSCRNTLPSLAANTYSANILGANNYGVPMSGILVVRSTFSGAATMKSYMVTMVGGESASGLFPMGTSNYAAASAPFTVTETPNSPSGQNWITVHNDSTTTAETIDYTFTSFYANGNFICQ